tara:strand:+ start:283 stop:1191 length:909 start_codon:yes stop_codon:yes gene_type:complete
VPEKIKISDTLKLPATVLANENVKISTVVTEKIKRIHFEEGKFVRKNQLLVELMDSEEQAILEQINAELEEANLNYERALKLSSKGNISQSILDNKLMIKKKLNAQVTQIKAKIDDLKIKAPFEGLTSVRNFSEGSLLKPGDVITNLYDIKKLKIQAFVPEGYIEKIKNNMEFEIQIKLLKKINLKGRISVIDPLINEKTRTFKILGKINNYQNKIMPGMMVNLEIALDQREAMLVRESAVFNVDDISYVYVVANNRIEKKRIKIGSRNNGMIEILSGINFDDLIVYEGINKIKIDSIVKIK